jgi:hypothetical protein
VDCSEDGAHEILDRLEDTTDATDCPTATTSIFTDFDDRFVLCLREAAA